MAPGDCSAKKSPVAPGAGWPTTVSRAPPRPKAITGVPQACASTGRMPKSSSAAKTNARARRSSVAQRLARHLADELDVRAGGRAHLSRLRSVADDHQPAVGELAKRRDDRVDALVRHPARGGDEVAARRRRQATSPAA